MRNKPLSPLMTSLATIVIAGICFVGWGLCLLMFRVNTNIISDILLAVFSAAGFIIIPRWLAHHMGYAIAPLVIDKKAAGLLAIGISLFLSYVLRSKEVIHALIIATGEEYLFRVVIISILVSCFSRKQSIVIGSVLFAVVLHLNGDFWFNMITKFPVSLGLYYLADRFGLQSSIAVHWLYNGVIGAIVG